MREKQTLILIVMGVCGVGKTSVAKALAERLEGRYVEADEFHSPDNIEAMRQGIPLSDDMRGPWLRGISDEIQSLQQTHPSQPIVVACSALKESYRAILRDGLPEATFVFLTAPKSLIAERMTGRKDHFMPLELLESQLADLEPPSEGEKHIPIDASLPQELIVASVLAELAHQSDQILQMR
ncbi:gluconokinase [Cohaesibacter gelatinilyticus]|uniref:Gluconokinase n=1 Tax=Cohaesibacter gelatinilyticus TaxID=372072 RepID=A0A285PEH8_9HYPH|nr:gluconokinase [Cohaesibacter gelatinilyticus]SNZ19607.1 gluconate kinase, SKI family [Cohaesibacter gelatinilyticus]